MRQGLLALTLTLVPLIAAAQDVAGIQRMFEAGQYRQVTAAATAGVAPSITYLAGQSHQKLGEVAPAMEMYAQLVASADPVWQNIGRSAQQLLQGQLEPAQFSAQAAVGAGPAVTEAHMQLGLVHAQRMAWREAAAEFDRAAEISPTNAYAQYYGGLMHYRANRLDQMAVRFDRFLKLAPNAPERPEVQQIMRTIRG